MKAIAVSARIPAAVLAALAKHYTSSGIVVRGTGGMVNQALLDFLDLLADAKQKSQADSVANVTVAAAFSALKGGGDNANVE